MGKWCFNGECFTKFGFNGEILTNTGFNGELIPTFRGWMFLGDIDSTTYKIYEDETFTNELSSGSTKSIWLYGTQLGNRNILVITPTTYKVYKDETFSSEISSGTFSTNLMSVSSLSDGRILVSYSTGSSKAGCKIYEDETFTNELLSTDTLVDYSVSGRVASRFITAIELLDGRVALYWSIGGPSGSRILYQIYSDLSFTQVVSSGDVKWTTYGGFSYGIIQLSDGRLAVSVSYGSISTLYAVKIYSDGELTTLLDNHSVDFTGYPIQLK